MRWLLYPYSGSITDERIVAWGYDAKVNAAVDEHVAAHGPFPDEGDEYERFCAGVEKPGVEEAVAILTDLGLATFRRERW